MHCRDPREVNNATGCLRRNINSPSVIAESRTGSRAGLGRQLRKERAQFDRGFELRGVIKLLERAGEGIRQAPHGPGRELRVFGLKVEPMDFRQKTPWSIEGTIDERECRRSALRARR